MNPTIEVQATEDGYAAVILDPAGEVCLWITDSYLQIADAQLAARDWIARHCRIPATA